VTISPTIQISIIKGEMNGKLVYNNHVWSKTIWFKSKSIIEEGLILKKKMLKSILKVEPNMHLMYVWILELWWTYRNHNAC
jgi:hypothetical protein